MIDAIDETIRQLLIQKVPLNLAAVDISFEAPDREWSGGISKPTINIYLHDVRENLDERKNVNAWQTTNVTSTQITRMRQAKSIDLSYIITVWTREIEDEHRLLWYVLATLMRHRFMPPELFPPELQNQPYPMLVKVAQSDGVLRNLADVWTAMDNQLKPVLPFVVTVSLDPHIFETVPLARSKFIRSFGPGLAPLPAKEKPEWLGKDTSNYYYSEQEIPPAALRRPEPDTTVQVIQHVQIGGTVMDAQDRPIANAEVVLVEQGLNVRTDTRGRYRFSSMAERSTITVLAVAPGYVTARQEFALSSNSFDVRMQREDEAKS